ncbi:hypothetical protein, partial [Deinococcus aquaedulcis]|uniref:hypothetical protein n=1 Tax=Deinococcus aquaedulcis TaxID=2840455 RepID=UPI001C82F1CD
MLATLFLTTTHLPGVVALAAPQIFARVGPGASDFPASFAAFTDPTFGEIGDAINVANGNAYFQTANVNWNNLTVPGMTTGTGGSTGGSTGGTGGGSTGGTGGGSVDPQPTPCKPGQPCTDPVGPQPMSTSSARTSKTTSTSSSMSTTSYSASSTSTTVASKTQTNGVLRLYGFNSAHGSPVAAEYALGQGDGSQQLFRRATEDEINTGPSWIRERYAGIRAGVTFFISK